MASVVRRSVVGGVEWFGFCGVGGLPGVIGCEVGVVRSGARAFILSLWGFRPVAVSTRSAFVRVSGRCGRYAVVMLVSGFLRVWILGAELAVVLASTGCLSVRVGMCVVFVSPQCFSAKSGRELVGVTLSLSWMWCYVGGPGRYAADGLRGC